MHHSYACNWQAELSDYSTKEIKTFPIEVTSLKIPLSQADKGIDVQCSIEQSDIFSIGIFQRDKVDILCSYPDGQMFTARAINIFDTSTGEKITYQVMLFFGNSQKRNEILYRLHVDCK
jgi:hypothetical protein